MKQIAKVAIAGTMILSAFACSTKNAQTNESATDSSRARMNDTVTSYTGKSGATNEQVTILNTSATIRAIDYTTREVTLEGSDGTSFTVTAGPEVLRFKELKPQDTVQLAIAQSLVYEVRQPTAEEKANPRSEMAAVERAPANEPPGVGAIRTIKAVVTVTKIDKSNQLVEVKGPSGRLVTAKILDPKVVNSLKIGDTVVAAYSEAVALSIEKSQR